MLQKIGASEDKNLLDYSEYSLNDYYGLWKEMMFTKFDYGHNECEFVCG